MDNTITQFNGQRYFYKIEISNGKDKSVLYYHHIDQLIIEESAFNWFTKGALILKDDYAYIERGFPEYPPSDSVPVGGTKPFTIFRNDSRNTVSVLIYPIDPKGEVELDSEKWVLKYDFVIYDIQDINMNDHSKKKKKLLLWEEVYQRFLERNIQWSTYYVAADKLKTKKPLKDCSCKVGEAIKHIIKTACGDTEYNKISELPDVSEFEKKRWDNGADQNKIFYTSPANSSVANDLDYLISLYISKKRTNDKRKLGTPGFLSRMRVSKKWTLEGMKQYYERAEGDPGDDQVEHFYIASDNHHKHYHGIKRVPRILGDINRDVNGGITSSIFSYRFVSMSALDDLDTMTDKQAIYYDNKACLWKLYYQDPSMPAVRKLSRQDLWEKLFNTKGSLFNYHSDKEKGIIIEPKHIQVQTKAAKVLWRNNMLKDGLLLNHAVEFITPGLTIRCPGKWIAIDRVDNLSPGGCEYDDKLIGIWFISSVTHNFYGNTYFTAMIGTKLHSTNQLNSFEKAEKEDE